MLIFSYVWRIFAAYVTCLSCAQLEIKHIALFPTLFLLILYINKICPTSKNRQTYLRKASCCSTPKLLRFRCKLFLRFAAADSCRSVPSSEFRFRKSGCRETTTPPCSSCRRLKRRPICQIIRFKVIDVPKLKIQGDYVQSLFSPLPPFFHASVSFVYINFVYLIAGISRTFFQFMLVLDYLNHSKVRKKKFIKRPTYQRRNVNLCQLQNSEGLFLNAEVAAFQRRIAAEDDLCLAGADRTFEEGRTRCVDRQKRCVFNDLGNCVFNIIESIFIMFILCRFLWKNS